MSNCNVGDGMDGEGVKSRDACRIWIDPSFLAWATVCILMTLSCTR